jgi:hypothetical protein
MRALQFATAIANLASQNAFKFLRLVTLPGDPRSNFHRLILICHSNPVWVPVSPLELLSHPPTRCEDDRYVDRYKVHTVTTLLAEELVLYLLVFRLLCSPGPCIRVEKGVKGLATCTGTRRVADCSSSWIHYAHIKGHSVQPELGPEGAGAPRPVRLCLLLPFAEVPTASFFLSWDKVTKIP